MKKALLISALCFVSHSALSQGFETVVFAAEDASKLSEDYVNPFVKGLMYDLNSGWYTTAKTHNKFGFDLTINPSLSFVPSSEQFFSFNQDDYRYLSLPDGETRIPTVMSESEHETLIRVSIPHEGEIG